MALILISGVRKGQTSDLPTGALLTISVSFIGVVGLLVLAPISQICRAWLGGHSVDFTIFTQALSNITAKGAPVTSMIGLEPSNLLAHHFTPVLYLISPLTYIAPAYVLLPILQVVSFAFALGAIWAYGTHVGIRRPLLSLTLLALVFHPTVRQTLSWSVHDEVFAIGLISWAFYFLLTAAPAAVMLCCLTLFLFKETFFLFAISIGVVGLLLPTSNARHTHARWWYLLLILFGLIATIVYFAILPSFSPRTFSISDRIAWPSLWSWEMVRKKITWGVTIFLPSLGLGWFTKKGRLLLLACAPFWGAILISAMPAMWKVQIYYSLSIVVTSYLSLVVWFEENKSSQDRALGMLPILILGACAIGMQVKPIDQVRKFLSEPSDRPHSLSIFPVGSRIVVSEFDALVLPFDVTAIRLWTANRLPTKWDYILERKPPNEAVSESLKEGSSICWHNMNWSVRCRSTLSAELLRPHSVEPRRSFAQGRSGQGG
jgi:uncharacterized membrane protein